MPWVERRRTAGLTLMTKTSKRFQAATRGYRTRTPSIQTKNRISCKHDQQRALPHGGSPSSPALCERILWQQSDTAARCIKAWRGKEDYNIPGRSIPQWYSYRLFEKPMRKATGHTVSLSTTISQRPLPAASTGAYLKRKQRANLLIRSIIPSLSRKESWKERRYTMASVVAWKLHGPAINREALGHQNVGKRHALMSRPTVDRDQCSDGCAHEHYNEHIAALYPERQRRLRLMGKSSTAARSTAGRVSPWQLSETMEENFVARHLLRRAVKSGEEPAATMARPAEGDPGATDVCLSTG